MTEIIDFSKKKKEKESYKSKSNHDLVLDYCDEVFPEGVVLIAIVNNDLEVSSSIEEEDVLYSAVEAALKTIKRNINGE